MKSLRQILRERVWVPVQALLLMGVTPRRIALSIATGTVIGIFPLLGTTTMLCVILALTLRLNMVAMQAFNWLVAGIQLMLILPFIRLGERVYQAAPLPLTRAEIEPLLDEGAWHVVQTLGFSLIHAVTGWLMIAPILFAMAYFISVPLLERSRFARKDDHLSAIN